VKKINWSKIVLADLVLFAGLFLILSMMAQGLSSSTQALQDISQVYSESPNEDNIGTFGAAGDIAAVAKQDIWMYLIGSILATIILYSGTQSVAWHELHAGTVFELLKISAVSTTVFGLMYLLQFFLVTTDGSAYYTGVLIPLTIVSLPAIIYSIGSNTIIFRIGFLYHLLIGLLALVLGIICLVFVSGGLLSLGVSRWVSLIFGGSLMGLFYSAQKYFMMRWNYS
jgi:hypothetical protein